MRRPTSESKTIRAVLVQAMTRGEYASDDHLPPESVLAETMGISRTQLRDVLAGLEREGFITRRHGIGTVINRHVLNVPARMDIELEFFDMIRLCGHEPAVRSVQAIEEGADAWVACQLGIPEGMPVMRVSKLCTADGVPAIFCEDFIDRAKVNGSPLQEELEQPIFYMLSKFCDEESYLDLTDVRPILATDRLSEQLQVPQGAPLLQLDEVDYNIDGNPVFCSHQYFVPELIRWTVLRKKL